MIGQGHDPELLQSLKRIIVKNQRFALVFCVGTHRELGALLRQALLNEDASLSLHAVEIEPADESVFKAILRSKAPENCQGIFVDGFWRWAIESNRPNEAGWIRDLNATRGLFQSEFHCPVIFCVPPFLYRMIASGAPDFVSVASAFLDCDGNNLREDFQNLRSSITEGGPYGTLLEQERIPTLANLIERVSRQPNSAARNSELAALRNDLGNLYRATGQFDLAEPLHVDALALYREVLGSRHPNTIGSMNNLAELYRATGRFDLAETLYVDALALYREVLGPRHPDTITSMNNLAGLYYLTGRYDLAEPLYVDALALRQEVLGSRHPDTITSMNNLAGLYRATGRFDLAEPLYVAALALRQEVLGPRHPNTITSMNNLGLLYDRTGRFDLAETLFVDALALRQEVLGSRHPDTITSMNNLAELYSATGRYDLAEPLFVDALALCQDILGPRHPDTITSMNNLAGLYRATGRFDLAEPLFVDALALYREVLGPRHPNTITSMNNLGGFWSERGDPRGAEMLCEAYRLSRELPEAHPVRLTVEEWVVGLRLDCGG